MIRRFFFLLFMLPVMAWAVSVAPTTQTVPTVPFWSSDDSLLGYGIPKYEGPEIPAACSYLYGVKTNSAWSGAYESYAQGANLDKANCRYRTTGGNLYEAAIVRSFACPSGTTLSNGVCVKKTCQSGYILNPTTGMCDEQCKPGQYLGPDGKCKCDNGADTGTDGTCCPVKGSGGGAPFQWCYVDSPSASSCNSSGQNGCNIRCNGVTFQKGSGDQVSVYPKQALGSNCSYTGTKTAPGTGGGPLTNEQLNEVDKASKDPAKAKTPEGCLASGQGYVQSSSGTVCVSGGETGVTEKKTGDKKTEGPNGTTETKKDATHEQGPNGTGTTTTTTTTKNPDGTTTTTTTKTTKNPDGTITEEKETKTLNPDGTPKAPPSKETSTNDPGDFCKDNASSPLCKGQTDTCKDHPGRVGCGEWGDIPDAPDLGTLELGDRAGISPVGLAKVASCPSGVALPKGIGYYNWEPACQFAEAMAPIVIGFAWLAAFLIVIGVKTE